MLINFNIIKSQCLLCIILLLLDSEWNDEYIDFTMLFFLCVCVSVYTISSQNNASMFQKIIDTQQIRRE